jgi:hypothetical protein
LQKLTGVTHGENELVFVFLVGNPHQQFLQRSLFHRCAERWAAWWRQNWKRYLNDPRYSEITLPPLVDGSDATQAFPHGPKSKIYGGAHGAIIESVRNPQARMAFFDLDTGRIGTLPQQLRLTEGSPERLDDIQAWAATEGFDLMGTEYALSDTDQQHYVIRGLGMAAWQIETERWKTLRAEIHNQKPFKTGRRTDGLLANFDVAKGRYLPADTATFLFRTREGSYGVIFVGVEVLDDKVSPFTLAGQDEELRPNGLYKGRRFGYSLIAMDGAQTD